MRKQTPECSAHIPGARAECDLPNNALFNAAEFDFSVNHGTFEHNDDLPPVHVINEIRDDIVRVQSAKMAIETKAQSLGIYLDQLDHQAVRVLHDRSPANDATARGVIEFAIDQSATFTGSNALGRSYRGNIYNWMLKLYADTVDIAGKTIDLGDYYTSAVTIAEVFRDRPTTQVALDAVDKFLDSRLRFPGSTMANPKMRAELRSNLIRLCQIDASKRPVRQLYRSYMDEQRYLTLVASGASAIDTYHGLNSEPSANLDLAHERGPVTQLVSELAVFGGQRGLIDRVLEVAEDYGVRMIVIQAGVQQQLAEQGKGSFAEKHFTQLYKL